MVLRKGVFPVSKAIFRVSGIKTTSDLRGIGKHNLDRISETNLDIDRSRSGENITLKSCVQNYNSMFDYITNDLKKQHEEQMKTTRKSRQKSFSDKINNDKADVACEFLMSASPEFFEDKSREEIEKWAETSLDFVTQKIGIEKKNVLHAVVHMDEKTPHMHVVAVPLVEKYDGRRKENVLAISRKHFIKTRDDMAQVQTDYVDHLKENGFDLERGLEKSGAKHLDVARYKIQETQKDLKEIEKDLLEKSEQLESIDQKIKSNLEVVPDRHFKFKKDLKKEIKTEVVPKLFGKPEINKKETDNVVFSPKQLKKMEETINAAVAIKKDYERLQTTDLVQENKELNRQVDSLFRSLKGSREENQVLRSENKTLKSHISDLKDHVEVLTIEVRSAYRGIKEFIRDRTEDVRSFKKAFKDVVDIVKGKSKHERDMSGFKSLEGEFERSYKREQAKERNWGLER